MQIMRYSNTCSNFKGETNIKMKELEKNISNPTEDIVSPKEGLSIREEVAIEREKSFDQDKLKETEKEIQSLVSGEIKLDLKAGIEGDPDNESDEAIKLIQKEPNHDS